jgi:alcohol dehydrogenase class IV
VLEANLLSLRPGDPALVKFGELARILTGQAQAQPLDGVAWVQALVSDLEVPGLAAFGLSADRLELVAEMAMVASSMKANPVPLGREALVAILAKAM